MKEYKYFNTIEKLSRKGSVPGLETIGHLLEILGHPERELHIIHVAGTNGKGSTMAFLAEILKEAGFAVGRYISPAIQCYEERFQINGEFISKDYLGDYYHRIEEASCHMKKMGWETPTIFEAETAIAFLYFRDQKVDYALIETGMGGLKDATNVIEHPILTILTSISEDHKAFLGETLGEIARNKAGIIKNNTPAVLAFNLPIVNDIVKKTCERVGADFFPIKKEDLTDVRETPTGSAFYYLGEEYHIKLPGYHQVENAVTAIQAALLLHNTEGEERITREKIKEGLLKTRWPGRLEILADNPPFYMDGAHNPDGARKLADFLQKHFTNGKIVYIMGVLRDKEYVLMLNYLMPLATSVYTFTPANERGLEAGTLAKAVMSFGVPVTVCHNVTEAVRKARTEQKDADCFILCGSLSFMEEFRQNVYRQTLL